MRSENPAVVVGSLQELVDAVVAASGDGARRQRAELALTVDPLAVAEHLGLSTSTALRDQLAQSDVRGRKSAEAARALMDGKLRIPDGLSVRLRPSTEATR